MASEFNRIIRFCELPNVRHFCHVHRKQLALIFKHIIVFVLDALTREEGGREFSAQKHIGVVKIILPFRTQSICEISEENFQSFDTPPTPPPIGFSVPVIELCFARRQDHGLHVRHVADATDRPESPSFGIGHRNRLGTCELRKHRRWRR